MNTLEAFLLGILQGLAEYLPISSSGHLEILKDLLGIDLEAGQNLQFDIMLHVATVLSTIVVLWKEFAPLCRSFFTFKNDKKTRYVLKLILSAVPIGIVGVFFKDKIEKLYDGNIALVGVCLCVTALLLAFSYFFRTREQLYPAYDAEPAKKGRNITWLDAFVIGIAQAVAVLPGLSRSGATIATGILLGDKRDKVAKFSFFMVIIPILGEALLDIKDCLEPAAAAADGAAQASVGAAPLLVGFLAAFVAGCAACRWMIELVKKGKLVWFALYCAVVGILCIVL